MFDHLSLSERKRLFLIFMGITSVLVLGIWILMVREHINSLDGMNTVSETIGVELEGGENALAPSLGQIFWSNVANIQDVVANIPNILESKEIELNTEEY